MLCIFSPIHTVIQYSNFTNNIVTSLLGRKHTHVLCLCSSRKKTTYLLLNARVYFAVNERFFVGHLERNCSTQVHY